MENLKPKKVRDLAGGRARYSSTAFAEFSNLLINNLKVERTDNEKLNAAVEGFIKKTLIEDGQVGYDCITQKFAHVKGQGDNELGNPTTLIFIFENGTTFSRPAYYEADANGAYIIPAMEQNYSIAAMIKNTTDFMDECDIAILQNIKASKAPLYIVMKDEETQLSLMHAIQEQQEGQPVIIISEGLEDAVKGISTNYNYIADKLDEIKNKYRDRLFNKLGIMSANIDKKERVQVGEVNATTGQCVDYIYMIIDTFNKYCNYYNLPFKMSLNGSLEELYENPTEEKDNDEDFTEKEGEEDAGEAS